MLKTIRCYDKGYDYGCGYEYGCGYGDAYEYGLRIWLLLGYGYDSWSMATTKCMLTWSRVRVRVRVRSMATTKCMLTRRVIGLYIWRRLSVC